MLKVAYLLEVQKLCEMHDVVCLQEHGLEPFELNTLSCIHDEFLLWATSAVNTDNNILTGRPMVAHTHTHVRLMTFFPGQPGKAGTRNVNHSGF